jgi:hypothetical protein
MNKLYQEYIINPKSGMMSSSSYGKNPLMVLRKGYANDYFIDKLIPKKKFIEPYNMGNFKQRSLLTPKTKNLLKQKEKEIKKKKELQLRKHSVFYKKKEKKKEQIQDFLLKKRFSMYQNSEVINKSKILQRDVNKDDSMYLIKYLKKKKLG